jgi:hypothetical protein
VEAGASTRRPGVGLRFLTDPSDGDVSHWVTPVTRARVEVPGAVNTRMDMDVPLLASRRLPAPARAPALGEVRAGDAGAQLVVPLATRIVGGGDVREQRVPLGCLHPIQSEEAVVRGNQHRRHADVISTAAGLYHDRFGLTGSDEAAGGQAGVGNVADPRGSEQKLV